MMEIYEVLNQVHSEEEYMEFPEMETAACIRRVRTKLHDNRKKHVWRTIAAALIGGVVLSGGSRGTHERPLTAGLQTVSIRSSSGLDRR